MPDVIIGFSV
ncbi:hypothetical protein D039_2255A, partial [Vibrio parahaemolyticus EKP-028]